MRLQMSLWEPPQSSDTPLVWPTLDDEQRAAVVVALARLIAKAAIRPPQEGPASVAQEKTDE
jgi:hypothetical protein